MSAIMHLIEQRLSSPFPSSANITNHFNHLIHRRRSEFEHLLARRVVSCLVWTLWINKRNCVRCGSSYLLRPPVVGDLTRYRHKLKESRQVNESHFDLSVPRLF